MAKAGSGPDKVVKAALELAAKLGWRHVTLQDIAEDAKIGLAELYRQYRSKDDILAAFTASVDEQVLAGAEPPDPEESVRDRLFDALMRRFDTLKPYKDGLAAILRDGPADPVSAMCGGARLLRSMEWTLESVGVSSNGLKGAVQAKGLLLVYATTMRVWLRDDTEDMARTMAALDQRLARAEQFANSFIARGRGRRRDDYTEAEETGPDAPPA